MGRGQREREGRKSRPQEVTGGSWGTQERGEEGTAAKAALFNPG